MPLVGAMLPLRVIVGSSGNTIVLQRLPLQNDTIFYLIRYGYRRYSNEVGNIYTRRVFGQCLTLVRARGVAVPTELCGTSSSTFGAGSSATLRFGAGEKKPVMPDCLCLVVAISDHVHVATPSRPSACAYT